DGDTNGKAGGVTRETLHDYAMHARVNVTPGAGLECIRRPTTVGESTSAVQAGLTAPYWVRLTRSGETFTAECSADGVNWTPVGADLAESSVQIPMAQDVYVGLAVSSRAPGEVCVATFSNVSTTGAVTGAWENTGIGAAAQVAGNLPETFYVTVEDSAGHRKAVLHADPMVIGTGEWEVWNVPLSEFASAGLNLSGVKKVGLGVGNPASPGPGGTGKLIIDDLRLTRLATQ
ncbi:MAG: hypothetical protein KBE04_10485, partial [Phycisphaerae bacterium]|nr:hypothetical protein [Phycisphaerae bacterium]